MLLNVCEALQPRTAQEGEASALDSSFLGSSQAFQSQQSVLGEEGSLSPGSGALTGKSSQERLNNAAEQMLLPSFPMPQFVFISEISEILNAGNFSK